jgi:hypothetical protein
MLDPVPGIAVVNPVNIENIGSMNVTTDNALA